jgi:hypothetical protein
MRLLGLTFFILTACGGDEPDPHVVGACEGWTDNQGNPFTGVCEAACEAPPSSTGMTCDTTAGLNCAAFTFSNVDGCCIPDGTTIRFYECE